MQMRSGRVGNWNYYWHSMRRFVPQLQEGRHVQAEWGSWDYPYPSVLYIKPKAHNLLLLLLSISSSIIGSMEILCARKMTCSHRSFYQSLHPSLGAWRSFVSGKLHAHIEASISLFIHHWEHEILCVRKITCSHRSFCVEACSQLLSKRLVALHNTIASKGRHWQYEVDSITSNRTIEMMPTIHRFEFLIF